MPDSLFLPDNLLDSPAFELGISDAHFPELLCDFEDIPQRLYGVGCEDALQPGVAIIGARNATPYGLRTARAIAGWAAELGLVVYSGCARGCDQAAHRGALDAGGKTVAVMGCGADVVYPKRAQGLLAEIAATGAVVSQYPWGTEARPYRFRERNRLIAALSMLVIVTEARLPSGTLSTVHHALDLGVSIGAVPGSILCLESAAPNRLIGEGAFPIATRDDLAFACNMAAERLPVELLFEQMNEDEGESDESAERSAARIISALRAMPYLPDELAEELNLSLGEVVEMIGHLEVQGVVVRYPDGRYGSVNAA